MLIDHLKFQVFPITGKNFPSQKPKHFWTKIGQNWPKSTMRIMQILRARTCRRARGLIFSPFYQNQNFMGVCRRNHQDPTNRCRVICKKTFPNCKCQSEKFPAKHKWYLNFPPNLDSWHHGLSENIWFEGSVRPDGSVSAHLWTQENLLRVDGRVDGNRRLYKRSSRT